MSVKRPDCKLATFCRNRFVSLAKSLTDGLIIAFVARIEADTLTIYQMLNIWASARKQRWKWRWQKWKGFCTDLWWINQQVALLAPRQSWLAKVMVGERRVKYCMLRLPARLFTAHILYLSKLQTVFVQLETVFFPIVNPFCLCRYHIHCERKEWNIACWDF